MNGEETFITDPFSAFSELGDIALSANGLIDMVSRRWWQPWAIRPDRNGIGYLGTSLDDPTDELYFYLNMIQAEPLIMGIYLGPHGDPARDSLWTQVPL